LMWLFFDATWRVCCFVVLVFLLETMVFLFLTGLTEAVVCFFEACEAGFAYPVVVERARLIPTSMGK